METEANFLQISEGENEALAKNGAEDSMIELCGVSLRRHRITALPEIRSKKVKQVNLEIVINLEKLMEIENKLILNFLAEDLVNELCGVSLN